MTSNVQLQPLSIDSTIQHLSGSIQSVDNFLVDISATDTSLNNQQPMSDNGFTNIMIDSSD